MKRVIVTLPVIFLLALLFLGCAAAQAQTSRSATNAVPEQTEKSWEELSPPKCGWCEGKGIDRFNSHEKCAPCKGSGKGKLQLAFPVAGMLKAFHLAPVRRSSSEAIQGEMKFEMQRGGRLESPKGIPISISKPKGGETFIIVKWQLRDFDPKIHFKFEPSFLCLSLPDGSVREPLALEKFKASEGEAWGAQATVIVYGYGPGDKVEGEGLFSVPVSSLKGLKVLFFGHPFPVTEILEK